MGPDDVVSIRQPFTSTWPSSGTSRGLAADRCTASGSAKTIASTPCLDPPAARSQLRGAGRPQAVAELRLARSLIWRATSWIPRPIRMNSTPTAMAMAATPKAPPR